jgi:hypothetical protein
MVIVAGHVGSVSVPVAPVHVNVGGGLKQGGFPQTLGWTRCALADRASPVASASTARPTAKRILWTRRRLLE